MEQALAICTENKPATLVHALAEEVRWRFIAHKEKAKQAAQLNLEVVDNYIRMGWLLIDVKRELKSVEGAFNDFIEAEMPFGRTWAYKLIEGAKQFQRDLEWCEYRGQVAEKYGMTGELDLQTANALTLKQQVVGLSPNSFSDLFRKAELAKPKQLSSAMVRVENKPVFLKFAKTLSMAVMRWHRISKNEDFAGWSEAAKQTVANELQPLVELYNALIPAKA